MKLLNAVHEHQEDACQDKKNAVTGITKKLHQDHASISTAYCWDQGLKCYQLAFVEGYLPGGSLEMLFFEVI